MTPIPTDALPVVEAIRRDVPRPKKPPVMTKNNGLRWRKRNTAFCCPMGMLPYAASPEPVSIDDFEGSGLGFDDHAVECFAEFWDTREDPKAAVEAVWGDEC